MVRELEILAAAVDVDRDPEMGLDHGRALDVPAGPAAAPGAVPAGLLRARGLPEHEVRGIAFIRRDLDPCAVDHLVTRAPRQSAVVRKRRHVEQHVALGGIGVTALDQSRDHREHARDVPGRERLHRGPKHVQRIHVLLIGARELGRDRLGREAALGRRLNDLVLDVGDVAGVERIAEALLQQPEQQVEHDRRAGVADVRIVVDGRTADIHRRPLRIGRNEGLLAAGQRIVQLHGLGSRLAGRQGEDAAAVDGRSANAGSRHAYGRRPAYIARRARGSRAAMAARAGRPAPARSAVGVSAWPDPARGRRRGRRRAAPKGAPGSPARPCSGRAARGSLRSARTAPR